MAIFWSPSRANIRQQIRLINFLLDAADRASRGQFIPPATAIFLDYWTPAELEARRDHLVKLYRMTNTERHQAPQFVTA